MHERLGLAATIAREPDGMSSSLPAGVELRALHGILDLLPYGIILVDETGVVQRTNRTADDILRAATALTVTNRRLCAERPVDTATLRHALADLVARAAKHPGATQTRIWRPRSGAHIAALITARVDPHHVSARHLLTVIVADADARTTIDPVILRSLYDLTPAEARVAALLAAGQTPAQIARALAISMNTVRTHVRRVLAKTGSSRQAAFARRMLTGLVPLLSGRH